MAFLSAFTHSAACKAQVMYMRTHIFGSLFKSACMPTPCWSLSVAGTINQACLCSPDLLKDRGIRNGHFQHFLSHRMRQH